jgi:aldehyde:ferredoxin oxidoreductase
MMERIVRVNARSGDIESAPILERMAMWGGRQLIAHLMTDEVNPACSPLGRENKLIFAPGWLGGTAVPMTGRLSIGAKSPLTGGIKESNVGGDAGQRLARAGVRALILEDAPDEPAARVLWINRSSAQWIDDLPLARCRVRETLARLRERFGERCGFLVIGPAGEYCMTGAGVATTDPTGIQVRYAGRGGLGAVMGSKGIKAIVIDDEGMGPIAGKNPAQLRDASRRFTEMILANPGLENRRKFGTSSIVGPANELGLLPTRNFSQGSFEGIDGITGQRLAETIAARGGDGRSGTPCMTGCIIRCSNVFPDRDGHRRVASLQYENIALLGSNCGIGHLDGIAELNARCNDIGLDAIEMGCTLGVAMEAGLARFGDVDAAVGLLEQVSEATPMGRILGQGAAFAGQALGVRRVPTVKGQGIPGYDPRALKGNGVTYSTSPMGADHTAGNAYGTAKTLDPLCGDGQLENSRALQIRSAILDMSGLCLFARGPFTEDAELLAALVNGCYGSELAFSDIAWTSAETIDIERRFNDTAGASDRWTDVPEFMRTEPLPPHDTVYDISVETMQRIWEIEPNPTKF